MGCFFTKEQEYTNRHLSNQQLAATGYHQISNDRSNGTSEAVNPKTGIMTENQSNTTKENLEVSASPSEMRDDGELVCIMSRKGCKKISMKDFTLHQVLGQGAFGKIMLVKKNDTGELFAMKTLEKKFIQKTNQKFNTQQERDILVKMKCPFIVRMHYAFQTVSKLYIVMDFAAGGELFYHLRRSPIFTEDKAAFYSAEIILGVQALHENDIIHRDLKPENILIDAQGHLKLADFGLSKTGIKDDELTKTICGTAEYLAPEILLEEHSKAVDWWSLGAVLYVMLTGKTPFQNKNHQKMFLDRFNKPIEMQSWFAKETKSLLLGLLAVDPLTRLGINGVQEIKDHPFYANIDWKKLELKQIPPPFKPQLENPEDLKYFSKQFTDQMLRETPHSLMCSKDNYDQFSYQRSLVESKTPDLKKSSEIRM